MATNRTYTLLLNASTAPRQLEGLPPTGPVRVEHLKRSDYIRQAVREKNEHVMAQRIAALSRELSAEHLAINESLEGSLADGLD